MTTNTETRDQRRHRLMAEATEGMTFPEYVMCRTRTGDKIHVGPYGGSTTFCGVWLKVAPSQMAVDPERVEEKHRCESCFRHGLAEGGRHSHEYYVEQYRLLGEIRKATQHIW